MAHTDSSRAPIEEAETLQRTALEEVIELHPVRVTIAELQLRIAADPGDDDKAEQIRQAIRDLRRAGLFRYRNDDEVVEPTLAAFRAHELLTA